jgi:hypothetical protein
VVGTQAVGQRPAGRQPLGSCGGEEVGTALGSHHRTLPVGTTRELLPH